MSTTAVVLFVRAFEKFQLWRVLPGYTKEQVSLLRTEMEAQWERMEDVEQAVVDVLLRPEGLTLEPRRLASDIGKKVIMHVDKLREPRQTKPGTLIMSREGFDEVLSFSDEEMRKTAALRAGPPVQAHAEEKADLQGEVLANTPGLDSPELKKWMGDHVNVCPTEPPVAEPDKDGLMAMSMGARVRYDECTICKDKPPCPHVPVRDGKLVKDIKVFEVSLDPPPLGPTSVKEGSVFIGDRKVGTINNWEPSKPAVGIGNPKAIMHLNADRPYFVSGKTKVTVGLEPLEIDPSEGVATAKFGRIIEVERDLKGDVVKATEYDCSDAAMKLFENPTPETCPFLHDNIKTLYGVMPMPTEELPKVCTCGRPLTYAVDVVFVNKEDTNDLG